MWGYVILRLTPCGKSQGRVALTPLSAAALNGHETLVNTILQWVRNQEHETRPEWKASCLNAMLCAIQRHHMKVVGLLLPFVDVNSASPGLEGFTLLHLAILTHNIEAVRMFLQEPDVNPNFKAAYGRTALALAVKLGAEGIVQELCACEKTEIDCMSFVEAYVSNSQPLTTLLCQSYLERNPNGFLSLNSGQYSCYDKIIFGCLQHIKGLWCSSKGNDSCIDIESVNLFDLAPVSFRGDEAVGDSYFRDLAKLGMSLVESDGLHTANSAGHQKRDGRFGIGTIYLTLATRSRRLLERLLELHPDSVSKIDNRGQTALMAAFRSECEGSVELVLQLLSDERNASVMNAISESGYSALTYAVCHASQEQIHALITSHTFDLRLALTKDKDGMCPLTWAAKFAALTFFNGRWLSSEARSRSCLEICQSVLANLDCDELSRRIIELGEDNSGKNILSYFCPLPLKCLQTLLQACPPLVSQLRFPDATGRTPLIYSSRAASSHEVCTFLLDRYEMNCHYRDKSGRTALSYIAENLDRLSDGGLAARLAKNRGDLLVTDNQGWSPIRYAVANGNVWGSSPYYQLLEDPETEVEWTDEHGSNILHLALRGGSPEAIKLLLRRPSSAKWLNAPDADGRVPLAHIFTHFPEAPDTFGRKSCWERQCYHRLRYPDRRLLPGRRTAQQNAQLQAIQIVLNRHDILVHVPDKDGKTPLRHALEAKRALEGGYTPMEYLWVGEKRSEQSHAFLLRCIESLRAGGALDTGA